MNRLVGGKAEGMVEEMAEMVETVGEELVESVEEGMVEVEIVGVGMVEVETAVVEMVGGEMEGEEMAMAMVTVTATAMETVRRRRSCSWLGHIALASLFTHKKFPTFELCVLLACAAFVGRLLTCVLAD